MYNWITFPHRQSAIVDTIPDLVEDTQTTALVSKWVHWNGYTSIIGPSTALNFLLLSLCPCRLLDTHTLAKSLLVSFEKISRGENSRQINRQGVEYLKALIKSAGAYNKSKHSLQLFMCVCEPVKTLFITWEHDQTCRVDGCERTFHSVPLRRARSWRKEIYSMVQSLEGSWGGVN